MTTVPAQSNDQVQEIIALLLDKATILSPTVGVEEAAKILRVAPNHVLTLIKDGKIAATKPGKKWIIPTALLIENITADAKKAQKTRNTPKRKGGGQRFIVPSIKEMEKTLVPIKQTCN